MQTLLIVEDEKNQRMLYRMELEEVGYRVLETGDAWDALRVVQEARPDLIVFDLHMRGRDNIQLLKAIKEIDRSIPVVVYTGYTLCEDDLRCGLADAYIVKSSNLGPLKKAIMEALERRAGDPQPPRADVRQSPPEWLSARRQITGLPLYEG
jgi:CheY-like chemotaxis protein